MDTRAARRAAEKAARDLISTRAALVRRLGVLHAGRAHLADDVAQAAARGRQLVADTQAEAARLVAAAQDLAQHGEQRYTDAHHAATTAGWTATDLTALGFPPTSNSNSSARRRRSPAAEQPELQPAPVTLPAQPTDPDQQPAHAS